MIRPVYPTYFVTPVADRHLIYAPLHGLSAILNGGQLTQLRRAYRGEVDDVDPAIVEMARWLAEPMRPPAIPQGRIASPLFLGIITTRDCDMNCRYCDFVPSEQRRAVMDLETARAGVDAYLRLLAENGIAEGEIQFFGGEPFFQNTIIESLVAYARHRATKEGVSVAFNVTTNGLMSGKRAMWVADNFDAVVLSFDGAAFQDLHRPLLNGHGSYALVNRTAKILSEGKTDLVIRVCVTRESAARLLDLVRELAEAYVPGSVCFEPLTESPLSAANNLFPPDPVEFARQFFLAEDILLDHGIAAVSSGADIDSLQAGFCPVGRDAILVSPSGEINACYLMETEWMRAGLDLKFGRVNPTSREFLLDLEKLESIRDIARHPPILCETCLCRYHCAGGCHVNHRQIRQNNEYDAVCIRTRLVTIGKILRRMGASELYLRWLDDLSQIPNH